MRKISGTITIAIDGFSSSGKSSFAKNIARKFNLLYIDSGAMYRAVTLWAMENGAINEGVLKEAVIIEGLKTIDLSFILPENGENPHICLNGLDVENKIRTLSVSDWVSPVSRILQVREKMVFLQRKMAENSSVVMDGRDIGTVVFPRADIKIFLTTSAEIRAKRRYEELMNKGDSVEFSAVLENIMKRDDMDQNREISPLKKAEDSIVLDNSYMTQEEQMTWFLDKFKDILQ